MLELIDIRKEYVTAENVTVALKGVSMKFRESEFVSILGPSGCGKTTLLNIIGGLDRYTSGDLIINDKSTKLYKDKDWDIYRNHTIGFVFQTYNLIMHLNVSENVELALTLSGISEKERKQRVADVLERVGLSDKAKSQPNQLSGGQMQRVAIARALINNPDILLADEPTGALDSETSIQVMDLLKEISKEKLVIMVTHNPDLAYEYSTRIIRIKDGQVIDDSNPVTEEFAAPEEKEVGKKKSMSLWTALKLSGKNLKTKLARTLLVCLAGSIGIIGIALILSMSTGFQKYVDGIEEKALSEYPLTISKASTDLSFITEIMKNAQEKEERPEDKVYVNNMMSDVLKMMVDSTEENDLASFKEFIDNHETIQDHVIDIKYSYPAKFRVYKIDDDNVPNPTSVYPLSNVGDYSAFFTWTELLRDQDLLNEKYKLVAGDWPNEDDEIIVMLDANGEITDIVLYMLGLRSVDELYKIFMREEFVDENPTTYEYDEILNLEFNYLVNSDYFYKENESDTYYKYSNPNSTDASQLTKRIELLEQTNRKLKVVGIVKSKSQTDTASIMGGIGYTTALKNTVIDINVNSEVAKAQLENETIDIRNGNDFDLSNTFEDALSRIGYVDTKNPDTILIYPKSFDDKAEIIKIIDGYNDSVPKEQQIKYTDEVAILISSVDEILNAVTYVLIAFVSVSLVVSSIMIGVITYISVLERTKEIGVLRSIGASKRDIRRVFNAETLIVGLTAGLIGDGLSLLLLIPINAIINHFTKIPNMGMLPWQGAVALVLISTALTLIAGIIPAGFAAKRDPVVALRSE